MRVEYELMPEDWGAFAEYCAARSPRVQGSILSSRLLGSLVLAIAAFSLLGGSVWQRAPFAVLLAAAWWWATPRLMYRNVRRAALARERPCIRGRHTLESGPDGIRAKCDVSESVHTWAGVRSVTSAPEHVFVLIGDALGYAVPRGRVVSGDLDGFVKAVTEHVRVDA